MKLETIHIQNFKSIEDATCYVDKNLTILAGQNESGKSNILQALVRFSEEKFETDDITLGSKNKPSIECGFALDDEELKNLNEELSLKGKSKIKIKELRVCLDEEGKTYDCKDFVNHYIDNSFKNKFGFIADEKIKNALRDSERDKFELLKEYYAEIDENENPEEANELKKIIDIVDPVEEKILDYISSKTPKFILYNSFEDMIPDYFFCDDINSKNIRNLERYVKCDFNDIFNEEAEQIRKHKCQKISQFVTNDFKEKYMQSDVAVVLDIDSDKISIYIEDICNDEEKEPMRVSQRSQGFQWYFGFEVTLEGTDCKKDDIILIDEPGLFLHPKAQEDMRNVLEKFNKNQIIYTTHSPYLINARELHRIRLVEKSIDTNRTLIENKLHAKTDSNALKPIVDAIGYDLGSEFNNNKPVLITEGISDYFYIKGMEKIYEKNIEANITFANSANNIPNLVAIFWGLGIKEVFVLLDNDKKGKQICSKLCENHILSMDSIFMTNTESEGTVENLFNIEKMKEIIYPDDEISTDEFERQMQHERKFFISSSFYSVTNRNNKNVVNEKGETLFKNIIKRINSI